MNTETKSSYKQPVSVLVLIHDAAERILLLERADKPGFWQSVTGSLAWGETPFQAALRELAEETGLCVPAAQLRDWHQTQDYEIYAHWRHRYAPGVTRNTEHVFSVCVPSDAPIVLSEREHLRYLWCDLNTAAAKVFSPSNRESLLQLPQYIHRGNR
ncbi:dihydroneopterin triphosphate diphosphatase [Stenoxybacter acetivorans]|uniref:dihydroneopterin triphosphate diphosphatase n=1 Tax=Stenoxybacter acetivorans TaxID=422441 RepID=UPI00055F4DC0|nr:dihydroneopterin triphosphate diphosphatase [Stenoxybacter acetivorans]